jgi:hypothetical protein
LGGGFGYLTRRFGWTADNLLEVEIVTADGQVRRASLEDNEELFWAIRGAGHNYGVVTSFTFQLLDVGPIIFGGLVAWPYNQAEKILKGYRDITRNAPRELTVFNIILRAPVAPFVPKEGQGILICAMAVCYTGDLAKIDEVLAPIRELGEPLIDFLQELPYTQLQSFLNGTQPKGDHYYWKTEFASELSDDLLSILRDLGEKCPIPNAQFVIAHVGGALNEKEWDYSAIGNRDVNFIYGAAGRWEPEELQGDKYRQWIRDAWKQIRPFSTGSNYINFQTADDDETRVMDTYGQNFKRLKELKKKFDPNNLFRVNRNINPV